MFIMAKLSSRFGDQTLPSLKNIHKIFAKLDKKIVYLVSFLDIIDSESNK